MTDLVFIDLVFYRQSITIKTKQWDTPYRKFLYDEKWTKVNCVNNKHLRTTRAAIIKIKTHAEKMRYETGLPIWKCSMKSKKVGQYRVYNLTCKRVRGGENTS